MEKLSDRAKAEFRGVADWIERTVKGIAYKVDMAAKTVAKIVKGVLNGQHRARVLLPRSPALDSRRRPTGRLRIVGAGAAALVFAVSALLSGCYYRGRPPEYGRRGYGHRSDRRY